MKILFVAPDRDLLECYRKLLSEDLGETVTAFDGTQAIALLSAENFDILLVDRSLPRVSHEKVIECAHRKGVPVLLLTDDLAGVQDASGGSEPEGRLSYPFTFGALMDSLREAIQCPKTGKEEPR